MYMYIYICTYIYIYVCTQVRDFVDETLVDPPAVSVMRKVSRQSLCAYTYRHMHIYTYICICAYVLKHTISSMRLLWTLPPFWPIGEQCVCTVD